MTRYFRAFVACLLFVVLLLATYVVHARYLPVSVIFYSAMLDGAIAAVATLGIVAATRWFGVLDGFAKSLLFLLWLLGGYAFAISVPTVLDRSLSFYLLEKIDERGGRVPLNRFGYIFTHEYMRDHHLVEVRLTEQEASGTVSIDDGCVTLTSRGREMVRLSRFFRRELLARHRLLMGHYSDALTRPFPPGANAAADHCVPAR
jgi:hypothetical protein